MNSPPTCSAALRTGGVPHGASLARAVSSDNPCSLQNEAKPARNMIDQGQRFLDRKMKSRTGNKSEVKLSAASIISQMYHLYNN